jgi:predicted DNA-binding transcriptional regulator
MLQKALKQLGLKRREIDVTSALVELGGAKISTLASKCKLPRQTVYSILKKLSQRGLVTRSSKNGVIWFSSNPKELVQFVDNQKAELQKIKFSLKGDEVAFAEKVEERHPLPIVQYYEGSLGLKRLLEGILDVYKKGKSKKFRGYGINFFSAARGIEDYLNYFIRQRSKYGVETNLFIAKGPDDFGITDESRSYGRKIKHLDIEEQNAGIYLVGDRAYLFSYRDNVGVMIKNQAIAQLLKDAFDDHWNKSND